MSAPFDVPPPPLRHPDCSAIADNTFKARYGSGPDLVPVNNNHNWAFGAFIALAIVLILLGVIW